MSKKLGNIQMPDLNIVKVISVFIVGVYIITYAFLNNIRFLYLL